MTTQERISEMLKGVPAAEIHDELPRPPRLPNAPTELVCTVVSMLKFELREEKPGLVPPRFYIPAASDKYPLRILHVGKAIHYIYLDETRGSLQARNGPDEVANAIVQDFVTSQLMITEDAVPGIFWVSGKLNANDVATMYPDVLEEAIRKHKNWLLNLARLADNDWRRYRNHNVVSDLQRDAAREIGWKQEEHEWMNAEIATAIAGPRCIACTSPVTVETIVCPACRCILKPDEYKKLEFTKG